MIAIVVLLIIAIVFGAAALFQRIEITRLEAEHPPSGRFVRVDGGRLHVVDLGRRDGHAIVLLHGASTNLQDMRLALGNRLSARYRVIFVDRPGHGWSDRPDGIDDASPMRQAALIHEALERLDAGTATIVAHSWGASVALAYALAYPKNVAGLVLLAPLAYPRPPSVAWHDSIIDLLLTQSARISETPVFGSVFAHTFLYPLGKLLLRLAARDAFAPQKPPPDYIDQTGADLLLRPAAFRSNGEDLASIDEFLAAQDQRYGGIKAPTFIIAGDSDSVLSNDLNAKRLAKMLPAATLTLLPDVGHMVHFASPGRVVEAVEMLSKWGRGNKVPME